MGISKLKLLGCALLFVALVLGESVMRPNFRLKRHYTITNTAEMVPLVQLVDQYLASDCEADNTRKAYTQALGHFTDFMVTERHLAPSNLRFADIDRSLISNFRDYRESIESLNSAALRLRAVSRFCGWVSEKYCVQNPALDVRPVSVEHDSFKGLSDPEVRALIRTAKAQKEPIKRFLPLLYLYTGLRRDEAKNLLLGQISDDHRWILRVSGKSKNVRTVPITDELLPELDLYLSWRAQYPMASHHPLIPSPNRIRNQSVPVYDTKTAWKIVRDVCEEAGLPIEVCHPHALRHTFAYRTLAALEKKFTGLKRYEGMSRSLQVLMRAMGHTSINTTMRYLSLQEQDYFNAFHTNLEVTEV